MVVRCRTFVLSQRKAAKRSQLRTGSTSGGLGSVNPLPSKGGSGESTRIRPGNLFAKLGAVHAGGERGCESGHLEPFFFSGRPFFCCIVVSSLNPEFNQDRNGRLETQRQKTLRPSRAVLRFSC